MINISKKLIKNFIEDNLKTLLKQRGRPGGHGRDGDNSAQAVGTDANARLDNHLINDDNVDDNNGDNDDGDVYDNDED